MHLGVLAPPARTSGAGLGVMLLGVLGILLADPLSKLNGLKNALSPSSEPWANQIRE